ncbi:hypothetical protein EPI10_021031 [Gossypium australe]|uniref:Retrovirus-related Pol polyprotein from transposon TNT 1-94 n=1 Tax=Gossypium australe TaxID=47621 RepID=A0A5B6WFJ1_9ROSI|nr:hypothetical protein EPI10_021031 [Gossypium australe]
MFAVSSLSRFMHCYNVSHFKVAKRVLRVWFKKAKKVRFVGFTESDWTGSVDDIKSTSSYFFTIGSGVVSWSSRK